MRRRNIDTTRPVPYKTVAETAQELLVTQETQTSPRRPKFFGNGDRNCTIPMPFNK